MQSYMKKAFIIALVVAVTIPSFASASRFRGADIGGGAYLIDTTGDGVGDTRPQPGTGMGAGAAAGNFVDADNDGICDTFAAGGKRVLDGSVRTNIAEMRQIRQERQIRQAR